MRHVFEEELNQLNKDMITMGSMCENAIQTATTYIRYQTADKNAEIVDIVEQINHKERDIENMCLKLIMQQQPVARDLRTITSALKMVSDLERIGDNADDIAEIVSMNNIPTADVEAIELIDMAKAANEMLSDAINSFVKRDDELAKKVIDTDDAIDNYFNNIKLKLAEDFRDSSHNLDSVLDLFMISKYFERIGDHSVNIARWVLYMITGTLEGNTN